MPPKRAKLMTICNIPAINTAHKNKRKSPILVMAASTSAANPAAGPLTLKCDPLSEPITRPPMMPEINPLKKGAPDANDIPKHNGSATKKTTNPEGKSEDKVLVSNFIFNKIEKMKEYEQSMCLDCNNCIK